MNNLHRLFHQCTSVTKLDKKMYLQVSLNKKHFAHVSYTSPHKITLGPLFFYRNEAQARFALLHELGHLALNHDDCNHKIKKLPYLLLNSEERVERTMIAHKEEMCADKYAITYMVKSFGYTKLEAIGQIVRLFLSVGNKLKWDFYKDSMSHPADIDRILALLEMKL